MVEDAWSSACWEAARAQESKLLFSGCWSVKEICTDVVLSVGYPLGITYGSEIHHPLSAGSRGA